MNNWNSSNYGYGVVGSTLPFGGPHGSFTKSYGNSTDSAVATPLVNPPFKYALGREERSSGNNNVPYQRAGYGLKRFGRGMSRVTNPRVMRINNPRVPMKQIVKSEIRRAILPRSPICVLSNIAGFVTYNFMDNPPSADDRYSYRLYTACCEIDGETYSGTGPNKMLAKNICAENAIKDIVLKRHAQAKLKLGTMEEEANLDKDYQDEEEEGWKGLASLALFKMFNDWTAEGCDIPEDFYKPPPKGIHDSNTISKKPAKGMPKVPTDHHPVSLLTMLRGQVNYKDMGEEKDKEMGTIFSTSLEIDGKTYMGQASIKKESKKSCAMTALKEVYNIVYPQSVKPSGMIVNN